MNDQARQLLLRLIRDYGVELTHDPQRLNALLKDHAKGQLKREIFLCVQAVHEGIVTDLLNNQHLPLDALATRLAHQLEEDCGFDDQAAQWAVETWLMALGLSQQFSRKKTIHHPPLPSVVPSSIIATTPISTTVNVSARKNRFGTLQNASLDDDLTVLIDDSVSWFKNLVGWQHYYLNNNDGTVTDSRTGLEWMRFCLGQYWNGKTAEGRAIECTLQEALDAVQQLNHSGGICGYNDWRIPTWEELSSIRGSSSQVIDRKIFPNTPDSRFWTVTESTSQDLTGTTEKRFYTVNFNRFNAYYAFGTALARDVKYTRLVR